MEGRHLIQFRLKSLNEEASTEYFSADLQEAPWVDIRIEVSAPCVLDSISLSSSQAYPYFVGQVTYTTGQPPLLYDFPAFT